jgi:hypothetical protein
MIIVASIYPWDVKPGNVAFLWDRIRVVRVYRTAEKSRLIRP